MAFGQFTTAAYAIPAIAIQLRGHFKGSESVNGRRLLLRTPLVSEGNNHTGLA